jgi:UDP-glucose 4-epimerase
MRIVVVGATGNVGTSVVRALAGEPRVEEIVGVARRVPRLTVPGVRWVGADVARDPLEPILRDAAAVVHLAWLIQPSRDEAKLERVNVDGSRRVFEAAAATGVGTLVHASSVGVYSTGPKDRTVDESWPRDGIPTSFYSRHKAAAERILDAVESAHPEMRVVRLRPALIFKRGAATGIRRLFAGPLLPSPLVRRRFLKLVPRVPGLRFQAVHADDVAAAYRLAVLDERARGAYNVAAEPVLDPPTIAAALGARTVPVPPAALRIAAALTFRARLQPTPPGWVDMAFGTPVLDTARIRALGWAPERTSVEALLELIEGIGAGAGTETPPLDPGTSGPLRARELSGGMGALERP